MMNPVSLWQSILRRLPDGAIRRGLFRIAALPIPGKRAILRRFSATSETVVTLSHGVYMALDLSDPWQNAMSYGLYEPNELRIVRDLLKPGDVFIDVGAHVGFFTLAAAQAVGPSGHVLALEPVAENACALRRNVELNSFRAVTVIDAAASDRIGMAELYLARDRVTTGSDHAPAAGVDTANPVGGSLVDQATGHAVDAITVPTVTIDSACIEHGLAEVRLVKIDAEGAESLVLAGMTGVLHSDHPPAVICEISAARQSLTGQSGQSIAAILADAGYAGQAIVAEGLLPYDPDKFVWANVLFTIAN